MVFVKEIKQTNSIIGINVVFKKQQQNCLTMVDIKKIMVSWEILLLLYCY